MSVYTTEIASDVITSDNPIHQRLRKAYYLSLEYIYGDVLEIGCGEGRGVELIAPKAENFTGVDKIQQVIDRYPNVKNYVWAQEEPKNMGAWTYMLQRFELVKLEVAARDYAAVPAPGSSTRDKRRQRRVIDSVFKTITK